jgi:hypothetical protein
MENARPTYITHVEEYIKSPKGDDINILFSVNFRDNLWVLETSVFNKSNINKIYTKNEKVFDNEKSCFRFVGSVISKFKTFTIKLLCFDEEYPVEFVNSTLDKWIESK